MLSSDIDRTALNANKPICDVLFLPPNSALRIPASAAPASPNLRSVSAGSNPRTCIPEDTTVAVGKAAPCPTSVSTLYLFTNNAGHLTVVSGTTMLNFPRANGTSDMEEDSALSSPGKPVCPSGSAWLARRVTRPRPRSTIAFGALVEAFLAADVSAKQRCFAIPRY